MAPPGERSTPTGSGSPSGSPSPASPPSRTPSAAEEIRKGAVQVTAIGAIAAGVVFGLCPLAPGVLAVVAIAAPTSVRHIRGAFDRLFGERR